MKLASTLPSLPRSGPTFAVAPAFASVWQPEHPAELKICSACHTLKDAPGATGTVGPDLDKVLKGKSQEFIRTSIVDPNADVTKGYNPNIMPQDFKQKLSKQELDALVKYLLEAQG